MMMMTVKENSSIPRQQQLRQRLILACASLACFSIGSTVHRILLGIDSNVAAVRVEGEEKGHLDLDLDPLDGFVRDELNAEADTDPIMLENTRNILSASVNLIDITFGREATIEDFFYDGIVAEFCALNFTAGNQVGSSNFGGFIEKSDCRKGSKNAVRVNFRHAVTIAKRYDRYAAKFRGASRNVPTLLDLKGVVFHESRSGSIMVKNALLAMDSARNRVYAEAGPPGAAMKVCGEDFSKCSVTAAANLFRDVVYMMSRSSDPRGQNMFFIFRPESTRVMLPFRDAFSTTPWVFLYRDSTEAMMSQVGKTPAFSLDPSPKVQEYAKKEKFQIKDKTSIEIQAIQLATFRLSALRNFNNAAGIGLAVKYDGNFADAMIDDIIPIHFHTWMDKRGKERMLKIVEYSYAGDGLKPGKKLNAPKPIKVAVKRFLGKPHKQLEGNQYNIQNCEPRGGVRLMCPELSPD